MVANESSALTVARAYHRAWTSGDYAQAGRYLVDDLETDVPINTYPSKAEFLEALRTTGQATAAVHLLAEFGHAGEALLLYDLRLGPIGDLRVAEHFTVTDGRIVKIRHVHDTAALRAAGFAREG